MQPILSGIRSYMIANQNIDYSAFVYTYLTLPEIAKANTKFRKTKSEIYWETDKGVQYLVVNNSDSEPVKSPVFTKPDTLDDLIGTSYKNIPNWDCDINTLVNDRLVDEPDSFYIELGQSFIDDMTNKKLCEIKIKDTAILVSRPFMGDMKKTTFAGYRVVDEDESRFVVKFKQSEKLGNIYTYAAFLKY